MTIDVYASEPHYFDHVLPIWERLPIDVRGTLYVSSSSKRSHPDGVSVLPKTPSSKVTLVASYKDLQITRHVNRKVILMEHGAGQTYIGHKSQSYVGAPDREGVVGVLVPNFKAAAVHSRAHPDIPVAVIGSPRVEALRELARHDSSRIAVSTHWDCKVVPETRPAYPHFKTALSQLASRYPYAIGHAHPRIWPHMRQFYRNIGLIPEEQFADVVRSAGLYIADNSSTLFEFAALGKPVVVLNAPWFRRDVHHGGRFWEWSSVGVNANSSDGFFRAVEEALEDSDFLKSQRKQIVSQVYRQIEGSTDAAVDAVCALTNSLSYDKI